MFAKQLYTKQKNISIKIEKFCTVVQKNLKNSEIF